MATEPTGKLVLRICAMPKDVNANGDIFGGWLLSHIDLAGAGLAQEVARSRVATVAIESMSFDAPIQVGEYVCFYAQVQKIGRTSIRVGIESFALNLIKNESSRLVSRAAFTYVALDDHGRPTPVHRNDL
jgi:acyl-CoA thioesterase YciA